jgi:CRP/FNR family transcriptional regulator, polysaccharide utilization system transcription regulator
MYVERDCSVCLLKSSNCFAKLPLEDKAYISSFKSSTITKRGQIIFHEGRSPQGVYCLNDGKVKIYRLGSDGKEQVVRIVTPTSFFGLRALISGWNYSTSAVTLEDSVVCLIPKRQFLNITLKHPDVSHCLMVFLSSMLEDAESKLLSLAQKPVRERLAETLITLHQVFNKNGGNNHINLSRSDLANIVGTAPECVIRLLSEFKDENLINITGRKISVLNFEELKKIGRLS